MGVLRHAVLLMNTIYCSMHISYIRFCYVRFNVLAIYPNALFLVLYNFTIEQ